MGWLHLSSIVGPAAQSLRWGPTWLEGWMQETRSLGKVRWEGWELSGAFMVTVTYACPGAGLVLQCPT